MPLVSGANYSLTRVRELVRNDQKPYFSTTRATNCVIEELQLTLEEAKQFMISGIIQLTEDNFCESVLINGDVYDVYGKRIKKIPWYIKFSIFEDEGGFYLYNISFHPTEKQLTTIAEVLEKYSS